MDLIKITPGFCPNCGSILPHLRPNGSVKCYNCLTDWPPEGISLHTVFTKKNQILPDSNFMFSVFGDMKTEYTIPFNLYNKRKNILKKEEEDEGPIVERICSKCGNDKMSYATLQLRSADEGQTVFYTCTNCK